uniref:Peroxin-7 n=1 Tax=Chrysotila carterae TaxID=13221 RepID=A0A7S4F2T8_CHRCT
MFGAAASNAHNPNNDMEVPNAATDGISCVEWSPTANYLVAGSWDNQIRCWEVMSNGSTTPKASISHSAPILCASWSSDGARVYTGSCDKTAKVWDLATNQSMQVAAHDAPIKDIFWAPENNFLVTASWDKTIKFWDCKSPTPGATLQLPERAYATDVRGQLLVCATADRKVVIVNLSNPTQPHSIVASPLKCAICRAPSLVNRASECERDGARDRRGLGGTRQIPSRHACLCLYVMLVDSAISSSHFVKSV